MTQTVLFVCQHGAARSRIAAAWFNHVAPPGWTATSAGLAPDAELSPTAGRLLAGTAAEPHLDPAPPRSLSEASQAARIVAIDCDAEAATDRWTLDHEQFGKEMLAGIRARVEALAAEIGRPSRNSPG